MNILSLASSVIGLLIIMLIVLIANKINHRLLRFLILASGTLMAIVLTANMPYLFGDPATSTSAKAGEYLLYLCIIYLLVQAILKKRQNPDKGNN